ncbi:MAG: preprotein translocase subunit SecG [Patescibacteria group bacterium]
MFTQTLFPIFHIVVAILLIALILLQQRGGGLSPVFGGGGVYGTRRGVEKIVFRITIALAALFLLNALLSIPFYSRSRFAQISPAGNATTTPPTATTTSTAPTPSFNATSSQK